MSHSGSDFYKPFIFVLGALVLLTAFLVFVANTLSPSSGDDPLAIAEMKKSIAPVGRSRVVEQEQPAPAANDDASGDAAGNNAETAPSATESAQEETSASVDQAKVDDTSVVSESEPKSTEASSTATTAAAGVATAGVAASGAVAGSFKVKAVVATNCAGCHNDGLNGAAKPDDSAAWSALADKGIDQLTASVINGKGKMPARAESSLNDDEIRQAVELMIANANANATGAASTTAAAAATTTATATTAATTAVAAAPQVVTPAAPEATPPAETPALVKQVVDSACTACHLAGVAGAPKYGDSAAWAPRLEKGMDALVASSIAGIGVMPPRGGSTLDDDQMRLAVEYMLTK